MNSSSLIALLAALTIPLGGLDEKDAPKKAPPAKGEVTAAPGIDPSWLDKLDKKDAALLNELLGYAPPPLRDEASWIGTGPGAWREWKGRVIVVQSFTTKNDAGRRAARRAEEALESFSKDQVALVLLHTPEGAEKAEEFTKKKPFAAPILLDRKGAYCDDLGAYKKPVNVVIDRQGNVRAVGLTVKGLTACVERALAEPFDPTAEAREAPKEAAAGADFPQFPGAVNAARDLRGQRAPDFVVERWITREAPISGRLVVVDFWATWCGPCRAAIPHMNDLADRFGSRATFLGISDEPADAFERGLSQHSLGASSFRYALALDPQARMKNAVGITGIPHCMIVSSDGIVRWQGGPSTLTAEVMAALLAADEAIGAPSSRRPRRWEKE